MKKQTADSSTTTGHYSASKDIKKDPAAKPGSRYIYTEADLGEDILELSLGSVYTAAKQFAQNIYSKSSYVF